MKSTSAHIVITGRVKGAPKIKQDGSAVLVVKTLDEGAKVEEKFPKRRVRGKQPRLKQLIPAEDALRMVEDAAHGAADAERTSGDRRVNALHELTNRAMDQQKREMEQVKRKADAKVRRAAKAVVAARAPRERPESFASAITRHVNSPTRNLPRRRRSDFGSPSGRKSSLSRRPARGVARKTYPSRQVLDTDSE